MTGVLARSLSVLAALLLGLTAGAMLLIRLVLVPVWQGLPPSELRAWFTQRAVMMVTLAVNEPANRRFVDGTLDDDGTTALLARWRRWHDVRVALGLVGATAAAWALASSSPRR